MGWIARVLSSARRTIAGTPTTDVKSDPGGGANVTPALFLPPGDDARPLPGDYEYLAPTQRRGGWAVLGFQDAVNAGITAPGERRLYARDASGAVVASVYLQNDGTIVAENDTASMTWASDGTMTLDNGSGTIELQAGGTIDLNGVTIDTSGNIVTPGTVTASDFIVGAITLTTHQHNGGTEGDGTTGTPIP